MARYLGDFSDVYKWRPVDSLGPLYLEFAPRDVVWSGWVGDQDPTFEGLMNGEIIYFVVSWLEALMNIFHSAWNNYVNFGSDIGGYRYGAGPLGRTKGNIQSNLPSHPFRFIYSMVSNGSLLSTYGKWRQQRTSTLEIRQYKWDFEYLPRICRNSLWTWSLFPHCWFYCIWEVSRCNWCNLIIKRNQCYHSYCRLHRFYSWFLVIHKSIFQSYFPRDYWLWTDVYVAPMVDNTTTRQITFPTNVNFIDWWNSTVVYQGTIVPLFSHCKAALPSITMFLSIFSLFSIVKALFWHLTWRMTVVVMATNTLLVLFAMLHM